MGGFGDEENMELGQSRDVRRCDHCNAVFGSRNELFVHLREVGRPPDLPKGGGSDFLRGLAEKEPFKKTQFEQRVSGSSMKPN